MTKLTAKQKRIQAEEQALLQYEEFKKNLAFNLFILLGRADKLGIHYQIINDGDHDFTIKMCESAHEFLESSSNYRTLTFNNATEYDFDELECILNSVVRKKEEDRLAEEKLINAHKKAKELFTEEERQMLGLLDLY